MVAQVQSTIILLICVGFGLKGPSFFFTWLKMTQYVQTNAMSVLGHLSSSQNGGDPLLGLCLHVHCEMDVFDRWTVIVSCVTLPCTCNLFILHNCRYTKSGKYLRTNGTDLEKKEISVTVNHPSSFLIM